MARRTLGSPPLPAEHGAWAVLALPIVLGLAGAGWLAPASWAVAAAAVFVFLAQVALDPVGRRWFEGKPAPDGWAFRRVLWGAIELVLAVALLVVALATTSPTSRTALATTAAVAAALGAAYAAASVLGSGRHLAIELLGMAGSSMNAATIVIAEGAPIGIDVATAPVLAFVYCVSTVSWVRAWRRLPEARRSATVACVGVHGALVALLVGLRIPGWISGSAPIAALPLVARAGWGLSRPPKSLREVGLREVWVAVVFGGIAIAVLALR